MADPILLVKTKAILNDINYYERAESISEKAKEGFPLFRGIPQGILNWDLHSERSVIKKSTEWVLCFSAWKCVLHHHIGWINQSFTTWKPMISNSSLNVLRNAYFIYPWQPSTAGSFSPQWHQGNKRKWRINAQWDWCILKSSQQKYENTGVMTW